MNSILINHGFQTDKSSFQIRFNHNNNPDQSSIQAGCIMTSIRMNHDFRTDKKSLSKLNHDLISDQS
jgi:hypothetical protein